MLITAFLSFWVPNVAATSIMCPVVTAILDECKRVELFFKHGSTINTNKNFISAWAYI